MSKFIESGGEIWFRDSWTGYEKKYLERGKDFAGGDKFPLVRGVVKDPDKLEDEILPFIYAAIKDGK